MSIIFEIIKLQNQEGQRSIILYRYSLEFVILPITDRKNTFKIEK